MELPPFQSRLRGVIKCHPFWGASTFDAHVWSCFKDFPLRLVSYNDPSWRWWNEHLMCDILEGLHHPRLYTNLSPRSEPKTWPGDGAWNSTLATRSIFVEPKGDMAPGRAPPTNPNIQMIIYLWIWGSWGKWQRPPPKTSTEKNLVRPSCVWEKLSEYRIFGLKLINDMVRLRFKNSFLGRNIRDRTWGLPPGGTASSQGRLNQPTGWLLGRQGSLHDT